MEPSEGGEVRLTKSAIRSQPTLGLCIDPHITDDDNNNNNKMASYAASW